MIHTSMLCVEFMDALGHTPTSTLIVSTLAEGILDQRWRKHFLEASYRVRGKLILTIRHLKSTIEIPHGFELKNSAPFLLKAREVHKVSQSSLNEITSEFAAMSSSELETVKVKIFARLKAAGISPEGVSGLQEAFSNSRLKNPYEGLSTEYQHFQYYKQNLNLVVSLCACTHICRWLFQLRSTYVYLFICSDLPGACIGTY